ncbi:MAG: aminoacyl-tRNA hydrolase [Deltaproteobacteria bacterium]|nr:MAG: aminoacyl-tRNA hydrolase [Deltaproteobacteria bacterium]
MRLLVGLGNPGPKYQRTRHNVGFRIAAVAAEKMAVALDQARWNAILGEGRAGGGPVGVLLPQTYMNASGEPAGNAARFWKILPTELVVAHDDMDLEFGRVQVKVGGGDGGHNGLRSLKQHLGTPDFVRVRFGVGRPPPLWEGADWVLANFSPEEEAELGELVPQAADAAVAALLEGPLLAMNKYNRRQRQVAQ